MSNRASRRAQFAQNRKLATIGIRDGKVVQGVRGALTGSNRSRPRVKFKTAKGHPHTDAVRFLMALHEWLEPITK